MKQIYDLKNISSDLYAEILFSEYYKIYNSYEFGGLS